MYQLSQEADSGETLRFTGTELEYFQLEAPG